MVYRGNKYLSKQFPPSILESVNSFPQTSPQNDLFKLTRQLIHAQFELADDHLANSLWNDVFHKNIDPERVINLMYSCSADDDDDLLRKADFAFLNN